MFTNVLYFCRIDRVLLSLLSLLGLHGKKWHLLTLNITSGYFDLTFDTLKSIIMGYFVAYNNPSLVNDQFTILYLSYDIFVQFRLIIKIRPPTPLLPTPILSFT